MRTPLSTLSDRDILTALAHRSAPVKKLLAALHPQQRAVLNSKARFIAARAGRRSGKTTLNGAVLAVALEECGFDEACVFVARTREIARRLIWGKLKQLHVEHGFAWTFNESTLEIRNNRGGYIAVVGADKLQEIEKLRGLKLRVAILDEPATYSHVIEPLVRDVIEPALGDLRGKLYATGTPGIVCGGWWFEVSSGQRSKWRVFHWTIRDNPFFRDADEYLAELLAENGWAEDHPTYVREHLAEWVHNPDDLVYRIRDTNIVETLPPTYSSRWYHVLAIDYGVTESTAWVVLAWDREPPEAPAKRHPVYVIASEKRAGLPPSKVADITKEWWDRYRPVQTVGDAGGLGKAMIAEMIKRYPGVPIVNAEKTEKRATIEHLNGDLSAGNLLVVRAANRALLAEAAVLPWKEERAAVAGNFVLRQVPDPGYEDHLCDALLYGWRATTAQWPTKQPETPKTLSEWASTGPTKEWEPDDRDDMFG